MTHRHGALLGLLLAAYACEPTSNGGGAPPQPVGLNDASTGGSGDASTGGPGDASTGGSGDASTGGPGDASTGGPGDASTGGPGDAASGSRDGGAAGSESDDATCRDGIDNDHDGFTARASGAFAGKTSTHRSGLCLWDDGEEVIFHVVPPVSGRLWVEADFNFSIDSEIYAFVGQCGGAEPRTSCRRAADPASTHNRVYWDDAEAGADVYVVVDHAADGPDPTFDVVIQVFPAE